MAKKQFSDQKFTVVIEHRQCAYEPCSNQAIISKKKGSGYINVCREHYEKLFSAYASNWCEKHGLDTRKKMIDHCKHVARTLNLKVPT